MVRKDLIYLVISWVSHSLYVNYLFELNCTVLEHGTIFPHFPTHLYQRIRMPLTLNSWPSEPGLRIGYLNINNARNKIDDIGTILHNSGQLFHVFCFAGSRLSSQVADSKLKVAGYNILRLDSTGLKATGLLLYFASSMNCIRMHGLETHGVESIWLKVSIKHSKPFVV